jgi:hypothetical protein
MMRHQVRSIQHSVLCLFQVGLTVPGRPGVTNADQQDPGPYLEAGENRE